MDLKHCNLWIFVLFLVAQNALPQTVRVVEVFPFVFKPPQDQTFICPTGWTARGPLCYKAHIEELSWNDAVKTCKNLGGDLAMIKNINTNMFVGDLVKSSSSTKTKYWIGLNRQEIAAGNQNGATWANDEATELSVGHWVPNQPTDELTCVAASKMADTHYRWTMNWCEDKLPFVCQFSACLKDYFLCANGKCIPDSQKCNQKDDCGDYSDEQDCSSLCKKYETGASGSITHLNYAASSVCMWVLEGPVGTQIQFTFTALNTEDNLDVVDVFVGGRTIETSQYVATVSGQVQDASTLPTYISTNNFMIVRFSSDKTDQPQGFTAKWTTEYACEMKLVSGYTPQPGVPPTQTLSNQQAATSCINTCVTQQGCSAFQYVKAEKKCLMFGQVFAIKKDSCCDYYVKTCPNKAGNIPEKTLPMGGGEVQAAGSANLYSPFYPSPYYSNMKISWTIRYPAWTILTFEALDVGLAEGDSVTIYDSDNADDSKELAKFTGDNDDNPQIVMTTTNKVAYVFFESTSKSPGRGWFLRYQVGCKLEIKSTTAVIQSPAYDLFEYPNLQTCTWTITPPTPQKALLKFPINKIFATQATKDILKVVTDGKIAEERSFSGTNRPDDLEARNGSFLITFTSDALTSGVGFYAEYSVDCPAPNFNSHTQNKAGETISTKFGDQFNVVCEQGYYFAAEEFDGCDATPMSEVLMKCSKGGKWNRRRIPQCEPVYCGSAPAVVNGFVENITSVVLSGELTYGCFPGFTLSGTAKVECQYDSINKKGKWDTTPACQSATCSQLAQPASGKLNNTKKKKVPTATLR